jgi:hypothetical protein
MHTKFWSENRKRKYEDDIKMYMKEIVCEGVQWIHLA